MVDEKMLVFINDLLSSGEIPDLFPVEDRDDIINSMRAETKAAGLIDSNDNCWGTFITKVKQNLHVVCSSFPASKLLLICRGADHGDQSESPHGCCKAMAKP